MPLRKKLPRGFPAVKSRSFSSHLCDCVAVGALSHCRIVALSERQLVELVAPICLSVRAEYTFV